MIDSAGVLASLLAAAGFEDLLSVLIRVTLVAATGILLCFLVRKASAAKRHLIAMATLIALIAFPAAKVFLPAMDLPILPAPTSSRTEATRAVSLADATNAIVPEAPDGSAAEGVRSSVRDVPGRDLAGALILVYLAVYAALLLQILVSFLAAAATASRARRIDDAGLRRELRLACERLGVSRAVDLRESPGVTVPVVWGLFRPVLLLPVEARDWSREQLRVVFLHEVAHVARHDGVCLLLARIATAVFWFHPLVWQLARIARRECERCCDDLVLASGERATDYAAHLLAIVRSMSRPSRFPDVAPAMAQRSNLEGRLASILHSDQRRDPVSRSRLVVTIGFAALLLGAATAVHVVAAPESAEGAGDLALGPALDGYRDSEGVATPNERVEKEPPIPIGDPSDPEGLASVGPRNALDATAESAQRTEVLEVSVAPVPVYVVAGRSSRSKRSALHESGIELMRAGQYAQAITAFEEEIRQSGSVTAMYNLACAYSLRGDKRRAFDTLEGAIENGFDNTGHMTEDEDLRLLQGDPHFYQLVRLARDLQLYGSGRYGGMDDEEDWRRELPRLERVTREHPDVGRAWANLGFARLQAGDPKGATAAYERALHLGYQKPRTFYNLACCASRSGSIDEAFGFLDRADKSGFEIGVYMGSDTDLNALRGDPRYKAMLDRWDEKMAEQHREKQRVEERQRTD